MNRQTTERALASPALSRLRTISKVFDELVHIPGTNMRFGLDALMGLLPGGGDLVGGAVSAYAIVVAGKLGAPASVIARMALNIVVDALVGTIPLLGDLFDASWKANRKNLAILEQYVETPLETKRSSKLAVVAAIGMLLLLLVAIAAFSVWLIRQVIGLL